MSIKTELFEPVLAWLEAGAPHKKGKGIGFNMNSYAESNSMVQDFASKSCGTACCIAGAIVQFNKIEGFSDASAVKNILRLGGFLGMTEKQVLNLFFVADEIHEGQPDTGGLLGMYSLATITPDRAAKTLRHFMATGEVVWS